MNRLRFFTFIAFAFLAFATLVMSANRVDLVDITPCCADSTLISLELANRATDFGNVLRQIDDDPTRARQQVASNLKWDSWLFAPAYTLVLACLATGAWRFPRRFVRVAAAAAAGTAIATFLSDQAENWLTMRALHGPSDALLGNARTASLTKWALLGVTQLLLAPRYLPRKHQGAEAKLLTMIVVALQVLSASLALWGVYASARWSVNDPAIESCVTPFALSLVVMLILISRDRTFP
jgi:hypothetical protein